MTVFSDVVRHSSNGTSPCFDASSSSTVSLLNFELCTMISLLFLRALFGCTVSLVLSFELGYFLSFSAFIAFA